MQIIWPYWVEMTALEGVGSKFHHIKKCLFFFIFLHVGNCFHWNCTFKMFSAKINSKNHVKSQYKV